MKTDHMVIVSYVTNLTSRALNDDEINRLLFLIEKCNSVEQHEVKYVNLTFLFNAIASGRKIEAIKEHRILTGMNLKDSKDVVESVMGAYKPVE